MRGCDARMVGFEGEDEMVGVVGVDGKGQLMVNGHLNLVVCSGGSRMMTRSPEYPGLGSWVSILCEAPW